MTVWFVFLGMLMSVSAGYHEEIGIPLAARLMAAAKEPQMEGRVSGGRAVKAGDYPFVAGLVLQTNDGNWSACGASILTRTHLLTAAHCLDSIQEITAVLGSLYLFQGGKRIRAKEWKQHPQYVDTSHDYDIAVVTLRRAVKFSYYIDSISLPGIPTERGVVGQTAMVVGWGLTNDTEESIGDNAQLHQAKLNIIFGSKCKMAYGTTFPSTPAICTRGRSGKGTCTGDSGGPLFNNGFGQIVQVGVVSGGYKQCGSSLPGVSTEVFGYVDFIKGITGLNN